MVLWHSAIVAVSLAAFAILAWLGTRSVVRNDISTGLARQADGLELFLKKETHGSGEAAVIEETREFSTGLPVGSGVRLFNRSGTLLFARPERHHDMFMEVTRDVVVAGEGFRVSLWRSTEESETTLNDLRLVLLLLAPLFLMASLAGGWFLSRRALRPVDDVTDAAQKISLQDLSVQLTIPPHRDEVQRLCVAWNGMLRRLDASAKQLRQFTADASHELRTPVALIRTTAELALRKERSEADYRASLTRIQEEAQGLTNSLDSLLDLARADSGQSDFTMTDFDIRKLVEEIRPQMETIAMQHNLGFSVHMGADPMMVSGDRRALRRVLLVLLDNAVKFTPSPGRVDVVLKSSGKEAIVEVQDTGVGIASHHLSRIFDRFYQADESRCEGGAGLGLSIAQWIVQGHNGRILVESKPGQGSVFQVALPLLS
jgi:signal transduction histidine kinase